METILHMTQVTMLRALPAAVGHRSSTIIVLHGWHLPPCEVKKMREMFLNITQVTIWCAQSAEVGFCISAIPVLSRWCIAAIFEFDSLHVLASYYSLLLVSALMWHVCCSTSCSVAWLCAVSAEAWCSSAIPVVLTILHIHATFYV